MNFILNQELRNKAIRISVILTLLAANSMQKKPNPYNGTCPSFDSCADKGLIIDAKKFLGVWFLAANIPYPFQENQKCTFVNFFSSQSPNVVNFVKQEFSEITNKRRALGGNFLLTTPNQINITYTSLDLPFYFRLISMTCDYWVMVNCNDCGQYSKDSAGIHAYAFTRDQFPSQDIVNTYKGALDRCGVPGDSFDTQNQIDCTYFDSSE